MLQVEVVDIAGDAVTFAGPWCPSRYVTRPGVARRHSDGASTPMLSQEFQRTYGAIRSRLIKQGRIAP